MEKSKTPFLDRIKDGFLSVVALVGIGAGVAGAINGGIDLTPGDTGGSAGDIGAGSKTASKMSELGDFYEISNCIEAS
jgi:hypothetical protein